MKHQKMITRLYSSLSSTERSSVFHLIVFDPRPPTSPFCFSLGLVPHYLKHIFRISPLAASCSFIGQYELIKMYRWVNTFGCITPFNYHRGCTDAICCISIHSNTDFDWPRCDWCTLNTVFFVSAIIKFCVAAICVFSCHSNASPNLTLHKNDWTGVHRFQIWGKLVSERFSVSAVSLSWGVRKGIGREKAGLVHP